MNAFDDGRAQWIGRLAYLRNTVRQELIRRQLTEHVAPQSSVLDVGCGQGTQAIQLAKAGCTVTGVEPSAELRELCGTDAQSAGVELELLEGSLETLAASVDGRLFDVVCAHGVLMYLDDRPRAIALLAGRVTPGGMLSLTFRNGHALAFRPGMRRDWSAALAAFDSPTYTNELGVQARADRLDAVTADLAEASMDVVAWYGVRVFNDAVSSETEVETGEDLSALFDAEEQAARRDPYRWMASQFHVVAERRPA